MTAEEVADRLELRMLVDAYAAALDRRDLAGLLAVFTADGRFDICESDDGEPSHRFESAAGLGTIMDIVGGYGATMHLMANHTVALAGDRAEGEVYCQAHHLTAVDGETRDLVMTIRYRDRYARTPEGWRIASRRVVRLWNELRPVMAERTAF